MRLALALCLLFALVNSAHAGLFDEKPSSPNPSPSPPKKPLPTPASRPALPRPKAPSPTPSPDVNTVMMRQPVPDARVVDSAQRIIKEVFRDAFADSSIEGQAILAKRLLDEASEPQKVTGSEYALLTDAQTAAMKAGDIEQALLAARLLCGRYEVDQRAVVLDAIIGASKSAATGETATRASLADLNLALKAIGDGDYSLASAAAALAASCVPRGDPAQLAHVPAMSAQIQAAAAAYKQAEPAIVSLATNPADPAANLAAGRFYCFLMEQWERGLPLLAKSADGKFRALAARDLAGPKNIDDQMALATAWLAVTDPLPAVKQSCERRAAFWLTQALSQTDGLRKMVVQKRLLPLRTAHLQPGLFAEFFHGHDLAQLKLIRIDPQINFDWMGQAPDAGLSREDFSVRWTGWVKPPVAGTYKLRAWHDDGVRVWVDGKQIFDRWVDSNGVEQESIDLSADFHELRVEFFQSGAGSHMRLGWIPPGGNKSVPIPADALFHEPVPLTWYGLPPVAIDPDGVIHLTAALADIHGPNLRYFARTKEPRFIGWNNLSEWVAWKFDVPAGDYLVSVSYFLNPDLHGGRYVLTVGPGRFDRTVPLQGEMGQVVMVPLGSVRLPAGETLLSIVPKEINQQHLLDLTEVTLTPKR
jgi:hypothetical protein